MRWRPSWSALTEVPLMVPVPLMLLHHLGIHDRDKLESTVGLAHAAPTSEGRIRYCRHCTLCTPTNAVDIPKRARF